METTHTLPTYDASKMQQVGMTTAALEKMAAFAFVNALGFGPGAIRGDRWITPDMMGMYIADAAAQQRIIAATINIAHANEFVMMAKSGCFVIRTDEPLYMIYERVRCAEVANA